MDTVDILPLLPSWSLYSWPPTLIFTVELLYMSMISFNTADAIPFCWDHFVLTGVKPSQRLLPDLGILYSRFFFLCRLMMSRRIITFSKYPSTWTKPFCLLSNCTFAPILLSHTFAHSLINIFPIVIGRQFPLFSLPCTVFGKSVALHSFTSSGIPRPQHLLKIIATNFSLSCFNSGIPTRSGPDDIFLFISPLHVLTYSALILPYWMPCCVDEHSAILLSSWLPLSSLLVYTFLNFDIDRVTVLSFSALRISSRILVTAAFLFWW